jgi:hypothetical protein
MDGLLHGHGDTVPINSNELHLTATINISFNVDWTTSRSAFIRIDYF